MVLTDMVGQQTVAILNVAVKKFTHVAVSLLICRQAY